MILQHLQEELPIKNVILLCVLVLKPLYDRFVKGIKRYDLSASRRVRVTCRQSTATRYIRDAHNLTDYEMKVLQSCVLREYEDHSGLDYALQGYAMGLWWKATFSMKFLGCGGFWSNCVGGPVSFVLPKGFPSGGFMLSPIDASTTDVIHTEKYVLPWGTPLGWMIAPLWRAWLGRSMEVEMEIIKESLELIEGNAQWRDTASRLPENHVAVARFRSQRYGFLDFVKESLGGSKLHLAECTVFP